MQRRMTRRRVLRALGASGMAGGLMGCSTPVEQADLNLPLAPAMRIASFNIRYLNLTRRGQSGGRSLEDWQGRRHAALAAVRAIDPDILGFQEMESWDGIPQNGTPVQRTWMASQMPDYASVAGTSPDGRDSSQPIFYRRARFSALEGRTQSLDTALGAPADHNQISERAFAGYSDLVSWARLRDRTTGANLTVINLHLHFRSQRRQRLGAQLARRIANSAMERDDQVIVLGDMNVLAHARAMADLRAGGLTQIPSEGSSFHFNIGLNTFGAIDHILHGPGLSALSNVQIARWQVEETWPSDHYPVWVDLQPT